MQIFDYDHQRRFGGDINNFLGGAQLHGHIQRQHLIDVERNRVAHILLKTRQLESQSVGADWQVWKNVVSAVVALAGARNAGRVIGRRDLDLLEVIEVLQAALGAIRLALDVAPRFPGAFGHLLCAVDLHSSAVREVALKNDARFRYAANSSSVCESNRGK